MVMPPTSADTATAPRIRQYEQVHRRAVLKPSVNLTRKRTVPQWHAASISAGPFACIVKLPSLAEGPSATDSKGLSYHNDVLLLRITAIAPPMSELGQVQRFGPRPPTVRVALHCEHPAALLGAAAVGHKQTLALGTGALGKRIKPPVV
jgi:hypothetical protein